MEKLNDPVFGTLMYHEGNWRRKYEISIFGENWPVELIVRAYELPSDSQRATFANFERSKDTCMKEIEKAIFDYYESIIEDKRFDLGDSADELMPVVSKSSELKDLVTPGDILVQHWAPPNDKQIGFLFDCTWSPSYGVGVKLSDNKVIQVDSQNILL